MAEQTRSASGPEASGEPLGTTPAGGIVTEGEMAPGRRRIRRHKLAAFLVVAVLLAGVAIAVIALAGKEVAAVVYPSMAGALVTALITFTTGNVKEHQVVAGLGGTASALLSKLGGTPPRPGAPQ